MRDVKIALKRDMARGQTCLGRVGGQVRIRRPSLRLAGPFTNKAEGPQEAPHIPRDVIKTTKGYLE